MFIEILSDVDVIRMINVESTSNQLDESHEEEDFEVREL